MKSRFSVPTLPVCVALALGALLTQPVGAQYNRRMGGGGGPILWENSRISVKQLSVDTGATLPAAGDRVLLYLTADQSGRLPAEAVWQSAAEGTAQNRGPARVDAIAIELKDVAQNVAGGTPVEALDAQYGVEVTPLIDNPRVLVTKHRYAPNSYGGPVHLHSQDVVVVYLRGGYAWPFNGSLGAYQVHRGDVDVIPANTFHRLGNPGGDPLELLVVVPK